MGQRAKNAKMGEKNWICSAEKCSEKKRGAREFTPVEGHVTLLSNGINPVVQEESAQLMRN